MILKGSQRGGAKQLALHLLKEENEHVEIHEIRGFVSDDLHGALQEAHAISQGTRARQFLFSLSLNPPQKERVSIEVFEAAIEAAEQRLGLEGQPRAIVFHEKEGRRHAHAVWSRIDTIEMKAINLPFYKTRLRELSKEIYLENEWQMPRGLVDSAARDPRNFTLDEWQQAKRAGWHAGDLKALMQECWAASDTKAAFAHALSERGITLANGDRRGHVAITHTGEVLSVARYIGKKSKDVRARLGAPDKLPSVEQAKAEVARDMGNAAIRHINEARVRHLKEMAPLDVRRHAMTLSHGDERQKLKSAQEARWLQEVQVRSERFNRGVRGLWDRLTGKHAAIKRQNEYETIKAMERDRAQRQALVDAQLRERQRLQSEIQAARTRHARLLIELRQDRDQFRRIAPERPKSETPKQKQFERASRPDVNQPAPAIKDQFDRLTKLRSEASSKPQAKRRSDSDRRDPADRLDALRKGGRSPRPPSPERDRS